MQSIVRYCGLGAVLAAVTLVTACSGANGSSFGAAGVTPNMQGGEEISGASRVTPYLRGVRRQRGEAEVLIRIPRKKRTHRLHPEYVSASTQSMTVSVTGVSKQIFNLTPSSKGCFVSDGYTTCLETAFFPVGRQTVSVALYDQTGGSGNVLSEASEPLNIAPSAITNISITLDGVPVTAQALVYGSTEVEIPQGKPTSVPVNVVAYDADHNMIMSPGSYSSPIKVADGDTSGATKLSATSIRKPGATVVLRYDGSTALSSVTITPSVNGAAQSLGAATLTVSSNATAPTIAEYNIPTYASFPENIIAGPDGAFWFTESGGDKIGRIATTGTITEYSLPSPNGATQPQGITVGPDEALWFTQCSSNTIGRITTGGTISAYTLPHTNSAPNGITAGPDGALWFTESGVNKIGRITTLGAITEYSVPTNDSVPSGIATGPDGALWFTEYKADKIGRVTTLGAIAEYSVPTSNSQPVRIAAGPDGALWFTESLRGKIGRITTTGAIVEYTEPSSGPASGTQTNNPNGIAAGPDGAMWFTDSLTNTVNRITTFGVMTEYTVPTNGSGDSFPNGITAGPGGALWFTQVCSNQIGRLSLSASSNIRRAASRKLR